MERRLHLFWPLTFIGAGVLWILIQSGRVAVSNLWALTYVWPVILIGAGLGLLLRPYWQYAKPMISLLVVGALFLSVLFASQLGWNQPPGFALSGPIFLGGSGVRGSGHIVSEDRPVNGFSSIEISYPASTVIQQGTSESLSIEADDNVLPTIRTAVVAGVLEIDGVRDHQAYVIPTKPVKITITVKDLNKLSFSSAGETVIDGLHTEKLLTDLSGAGSMRMDNVELGSLDAELSGVGSLEASGAAKDLTVNVSGLGSFQGKQLHSQTASVQLDGMGSAEVWADSQLTARVSGVGSVNYYGNAQVTKSVSGLGSVQYMGAK